MTNIFRTPGFTPLPPRLFPLQETSNVSYYTVSSSPVADTTSILRSPVFNRYTIKYVDVNHTPPSLLISTLGIIVPQPFGLTDWPNPRGYRSNDLLTWLNTNTVFIPGPGTPTTKVFDYPNPTLGVIRREYGYTRPSYLIGGIPPTPLATLFAGRIVTLGEWEENVIHARPYREGMKQVIIREAAKALGRQGGIASGKTRRRG